MNGGPRTSFNFGTIDGGTSITSIPTEARAKLDIRSENGTRHRPPGPIAHHLRREGGSDRERALDHAGHGEAQGTRPQAGRRAAGEARPSSPIIRAVDAQLGIKAELDCASTDANIPLSMNLPAVSIGAGGQGGGAHTPVRVVPPGGPRDGPDAGAPGALAAAEGDRVTVAEPAIVVCRTAAGRTQDPFALAGGGRTGLHLPGLGRHLRRRQERAGGCLDAAVPGPSVHPGDPGPAGDLPVPRGASERRSDADRAAAESWPGAACSPAISCRPRD